MPFESLAQQRWGHTKEGEQALGGPSAVAEWDRATKGKTLPQRVGSHAGGGPVKSYEAQHNVAYAAGGPVLGRSTNFMKTPDTFRGSMQPNPPNEGTDENWGKGESGKKGDGGPGAPAAKDKSEKPVLPRK